MRSFFLLLLLLEYNDANFLKHTSWMLIRIALNTEAILMRGDSYEQSE